MQTSIHCLYKFQHHSANNSALFYNLDCLQHKLSSRLSRRLHRSLPLRSFSKHVSSSYQLSYYAPRMSSSPAGAATTLKRKNEENEDPAIAKKAKSLTSSSPASSSPASRALPRSTITPSAKPKKDSSITSFFGAPKPVATPAAKPGAPQNGIHTAAAVATTKKFDKDAWVAKLTPEQKELLQLEIDTLHESWLPHLADELTSKEFLGLKKFIKAELDSGKKIFPPLPEVYSWSRHTPLHSVKAVILGQDPYHNLNQAHGLCFSVRPPVPAPPSLKNIYTALKKDYPSFAPPPKNGGLLTPWADRGVLLLNTCLTVRAHEANSHANHGWEKFTQKVIDVVNKERRHGVVFLAWGSPAQKRCTGINGTKHLVLKSVHPSPLSASRGFFDCGHFKKTNEWLKARYGDEGVIDWDLNVAPEVAGT